MGPVLVKFGNQAANCEAIVLPRNTRPLLGVVAMESMRVIIDPIRHKLIADSELSMLVGIYKDEAV